MPTTVVFVHGYSVRSLSTYGFFPAPLVAQGFTRADIELSAFDSLDNCVTCDDLAEGLEDRMASLETQGFRNQECLRRALDRSNHRASLDFESDSVQPNGARDCKAASQSLRFTGGGEPWFDSRPAWRNDRQPHPAGRSRSGRGGPAGFERSRLRKRVSTKAQQRMDRCDRLRRAVGRFLLQHDRRRSQRFFRSALLADEREWL